MDGRTIRSGLPGKFCVGAARHQRFTAFTPAQAADIWHRFLPDASVEALPGDDTPYLVRAEVLELGPLTLGQLTTPPHTAVEARGVPGYHVTLPVSGRVRGGGSAAVPYRTALVHRPGDPVNLRHDAGAVHVRVKIERRALEAELEALTGRPARGVVDLAPTLDIATGPGRSWAQLVRLVRDESRCGNGLLFHPPLAERYWRSLVSGLLLAVAHDRQPAIAQPVSAGPPWAVRRVVDAIDAEPHQRYTVADLARIGGVSVRALQEGFRRHLGVSPTAYLQQVRLAHSHAALRRAGPQEATVAAVAYRWGFSHLGRFARAYRARYGVPPSTTLREAG